MEEEQYVIPELQLTITTYQLIGDKWEAVISHTFHGRTQQEIFGLIDAHKITDSFFAASFEGQFQYHMGTIYLRNSEAKVLYP